MLRVVCVCLCLGDCSDDRSAGLAHQCWAAGASLLLASAALCWPPANTALAQAQFGVSSNNSPPGHSSAGEASMVGAAVRWFGCVWNGRRGNSQVAASNGSDGIQVGSSLSGVADCCGWESPVNNVTEYSEW